MSYNDGMEVDFNSSVSGAHEDWFLRAVDEGLAAADRGEFIDHDDLRQMIDRKYPG
jgi:predicted transcriptional regulator